MKKIQWRCLILSILATLTIGTATATAYNSIGDPTGTLESDDISPDLITWSCDNVIDAVEWPIVSGEIALSVPGDITIEDLFVQDCVKIGWNRKTGKFVCHEYHKQISSKGEGKMFSFLFGVLGSVFFWAAYLGMTIVVGTMIVKKINPKFYKRVMGKGFNDYRWNNGSDWSAESAILIYLFWPIISILYIVKYALKWLLLKPFILAVRAAGKNLPTISFDKKPESE